MPERPTQTSTLRRIRELNAELEAREADVERLTEALRELVAHVYAPEWNAETLRDITLGITQNDSPQEIIAGAINGLVATAVNLRQENQQLTRERDQARWDYRQTGDEASLYRHVADVRANMLRYIAFVTCGDEHGDAQLGVDRMKAENARLTAALRTAREALQAALTLPRPRGDYSESTWAQWDAVVEQIEAALGQLHS